MGKRQPVALVFLVSRVILRLFLAVPSVCVKFVIAIFLDHTHLLFFMVSVTSASRYHPRY